MATFGGNSSIGKRLSDDGGDPVAVTRDAATDWSPEWSPDGRWLYFSSDRDGGMNLFRVRMDGSTGRARGEPETVTTSVGDLGWARFSADGKRLVAVAYERTAVIDFYRLHPRTLGVTGPLRTLRPRTLHWCPLSPDAAWLACATRPGVSAGLRGHHRQRPVQAVHRLDLGLHPE